MTIWRRKEGREGGRRRISPRERLSRPWDTIRPFSFLPKRRPMDDLMLFFFGALCRESEAPSLEKQGKQSPSWSLPSLLATPVSSSHLPPSQALSPLTCPEKAPRLPGTPLAMPRLGSFSPGELSGEWVVGCPLEWLGPPLVEPQLLPSGCDSGDRIRDLGLNCKYIGE